jgi:hypothetical protein
VTQTSSDVHAAAGYSEVLSAQHVTNGARQMAKHNVLQEIKMHRFLMSMVRTIKNTRGPNCEHCEAMLKDVHKCLDGELNDMRDRAKDE